MITELDNSCSGCFSCFNACPREAIKIDIKTNFYKMIVDKNLCVNCNLCENVCLINSNDVKRFLPKVIFGGITKDEKNWKRSASGGAFYDICKCYGDNETIVFGTIMDENLIAKMDYVVGVNNSNVFSGSKYIQSYVGQAYKQCKKFLNEGKKVIFSGTPCQNYALKLFLGKDYENLLCIDIICHGVSSTNIFKKHIEYLEKKYKKRIVSFKFRFKFKVFFHYIDYTPRIIFEDGKHKNLYNDKFIHSFLSGLNLNNSCTKCNFKCNQRVGDITIGDLKYAWKLIKKPKINKNLSLISINSNKGMSLVERLNDRMELFEIDKNEINRYNGSFFQT